ncbi:hypothetical protein [Alicyclobacillus pomorum]|jgi:hypothetical protein
MDKRKGRTIVRKLQTQNDDASLIREWILHSMHVLLLYEEGYLTTNPTQ